RPTVPIKQIAADINMDMFLPIIPLKVLTVLGLAESDLGDMARTAAQQQGVAVQPDPQPQRNIFIRSDQYSFILHGVPSLAMSVGFPDMYRTVQQNWLRDRYHAPADDLQQPVNLDTAAKYEEVLRALVLAAANTDKRPAW